MSGGRVVPNQPGQAATRLLSGWQGEFRWPTGWEVSGMSTKVPPILPYPSRVTLDMEEARPALVRLSSALLVSANKSSVIRKDCFQVRQDPLLKNLLW